MARRRPLPILPRGPRRRRRRAATSLFACPRIAPDWELAALRVLMKPKPHLRAKIAHRQGQQTWTASARTIIEQTRNDVAARLGFELDTHYPTDGDYFLACEVNREQCEEAKALAVLTSMRLPDLWFVLGRTFIKNGIFHRRKRGTELFLIPATDVHLTRPIRAAIRELLQSAACNRSPSRPSA